MRCGCEKTSNNAVRTRTCTPSIASIVLSSFHNMDCIAGVQMQGARNRRERLANDRYAGDSAVRAGVSPVLLLFATFLRLSHCYIVSLCVFCVLMRCRCADARRARLADEICVLRCGHNGLRCGHNVLRCGYNVLRCGHNVTVSRHFLAPKPVACVRACVVCFVTWTN